MARLYACFGIHPAEKGAPTRLAGAMNCSPQVITNWSARGVSIDGAIQAERLSGKGAAWILDGDGPQQVTKSIRAASATADTSSAVLAGEPISDGFQPWPFLRITRGQWFAIKSDERERIEAVICAMIFTPGAGSEKQLAA